MSSNFNNFLANLGFGTSDAQRSAQDSLADAKQNYEDLNTPDLVQETPAYAQTASAGPSEMGSISVDPAYKSAQMDQLSALSNLAANGGRSASSDYNLAQIQGQEQAQAKGSRDAVMQNMAARGISGGGADLISQLSSNQAAQSSANMQDLGVLANQSNTALSAGSQAAGIASGMQAQDFNQQAAKASAQDAINKFNTQNLNSNNQYNAQTANQAQQYNTGLQQTGYQNQVQKAAGISGANMAGVNYNQAQANMGATQAGGMLSGGVKLGAAAMGKAASGGKIPGIAPFKGDTTLNDIVPVNTSPGEVVVPRSLVKQGSVKDIGNFVKNPPHVKTPANDKEAMLGALANIRRKRMG